MSLPIEYSWPRRTRDRGKKLVDQVILDLTEDEVNFINDSLWFTVESPVFDTEYAGEVQRLMEQFPEHNPFDPTHSERIVLTRSDYLFLIDLLKHDDFDKETRDKILEKIDPRPKSLRFISQAKRAVGGKGWWGERARHSDAARKGNR